MSQIPEFHHVPPLLQSLLPPITPQEIIYQVISFLDSNEVEKCQLVNKSWKNLVAFNKNLIPLRYFEVLWISSRQNLPIYMRAHIKTMSEPCNLQIQVDDEMIVDIMSSVVTKNYSMKALDEKLKLLKNIVYGIILVVDCDSAILEPFLKHAMKVIGDGFKAKSCSCNARYLDMLGVEIFEKYVLVNHLDIRNLSEQFLTDIFDDQKCMLSYEKMLPDVPKSITIGELHMQDEESLELNGKVQGASRITLIISPHSHGTFVQNWYHGYKNARDLSRNIGTYEFRLKKFCKFQGKTLFEHTKMFLKSLSVQHTIEHENGILKYHFVVHKTQCYELVITMKHDIRDLRNVNQYLTNPAAYNDFDTLDRIMFSVRYL